MLGTALLVSLPVALALPQDDPGWAQFRGPGGRAVADDTPIPATFGPGENVRWRTKVPAGHSSPCIAGERLFLTGFEDGKNVLLTLDRASGELLWRREYEGSEHPDYYHPDARPALPTAVSDGEHVVAYFGNYGLVALDVEGGAAWERRLEHPGHGFGVGTSPLLYDGILVLSRDGGPEAGILALDVTDGSELWRIDRFDYGESHGTPFLWRNADRDELVVGGTTRLCGFDPGTGDRLWVLEGLCSFPCTTPTADEDTLYYAAWSTGGATGRSFWEAAFTRSLELSDAEVEDPKLLFERLDANGDGKIAPDEVPECRAKDAFGFLDQDRNGFWEVEEMTGAESPGQRAGQNLMVAVARGAEGDAGETHVRWTWDRGLPYVSSPLLYRDRIWLFKAGGLATCLDAKTGEPVFDRERLEDRSEYYLSPVGAAGHVLAGSAEGTLYVIDAGADELVVRHTAVFDEELFATPAVLDGVVYVRTESTMWAFGTAD